MDYQLTEQQLRTRIRRLQKGREHWKRRCFVHEIGVSAEGKRYQFFDREYNKALAEFHERFGAYRA